jgi:hypothetical protein
VRPRQKKRTQIQQIELLCRLVARELLVQIADFQLKIAAVQGSLAACGAHHGHIRSAAHGQVGGEVERTFDGGCCFDGLGKIRDLQFLDHGMQMVNGLGCGEVCRENAATAAAEHLECHRLEL